MLDFQILCGLCGLCANHEFRPYTFRQWYDLFSTLPAAAGVTAEDASKLDGKNLWDALRSGSVQNRGAFAIAAVDSAVFDSDWKLIETSDGNRSLFQLAQDPGETTDMYSSSTNIAHRLEAELHRITKDLPSASIRPRPNPGNRGSGIRGPKRAVEGSGKQ